MIWFLLVNVWFLCFYIDDKKRIMNIVDEYEVFPILFQYEPFEIWDRYFLLIINKIKPTFMFK